MFVCLCVFMHSHVYAYTCICRPIWMYGWLYVFMCAYSQQCVVIWRLEDNLGLFIKSTNHVPCLLSTGLSLAWDSLRIGIQAHATMPPSQQVLFTLILDMGLRSHAPKTSTLPTEPKHQEKGTNHILGVPRLWTKSKCNHLPSTYPSLPPHRGWNFSIQIWDGINIQDIATDQGQRDRANCLWSVL